MLHERRGDQSVRPHSVPSTGLKASGPAACDKNVTPSNTRDGQWEGPSDWRQAPWAERFSRSDSYREEQGTFDGIEPSEGKRE